MLLIKGIIGVIMIDLKILVIAIEVNIENLLINLKDTFFNTAVGPRPHLHACADSDETGSHLKK